MIHSNASANKAKIFGEVLSPSGSVRSMKTSPSHCKCRSSVCTGMFQKACATSTFAKRAPGGNCNMHLTAWSTVKHCREHHYGSMPSFTLLPGGKERSRIRCHYPTLLSFGITPSVLTCTFSTSSALNGPTILPDAYAVAKYCCTGPGILIANTMFAFVDTQLAPWCW